VVVDGGVDGGVDVGVGAVVVAGEPTDDEGLSSNKTKIKLYKKKGSRLAKGIAKRTGHNVF
jgi:hypothetical protein